MMMMIFVAAVVATRTPARERVAKRGVLFVGRVETVPARARRRRRGGDAKRDCTRVGRVRTTALNADFVEEEEEEEEEDDDGTPRLLHHPYLRRADWQTTTTTAA